MGGTGGHAYTGAMMDRLDVKICGLSTPDAVDAVIAGGATHAGFIFFEKSPRHVDLTTAETLAAQARKGGLKTVAVTVNADNEAITRIVSQMKPDVVQLHGKETADRVSDVKTLTALEVWKAMAIADADDLARVDAYRGNADRMLLDAKPPAGSNLPGGNAVSFDWSILNLLRAGTDYLLAGGINADNVLAALATNPPGLDVSSGVENGPGIKDTRKISAFMRRVRAVRP